MESKDNSLLFTLIATVIFIVLTTIVVNFDLVNKLADLFGSQQSFSEPKNITYYQWVEKGEMIISQSPPQNSQQAYISFQGDPKLTQVRYQVDPELIAKADAFRESVLNPKNYDETDPAQVLAALFTQEQQDLFSNNGQCSHLRNWLSNMSGLFTRYEEKSNREFCELFDKRMAYLSQIGCGEELAEFESKVCDRY